jgi:hypothetical protein
MDKKKLAKELVCLARDVVSVDRNADWDITMDVEELRDNISYEIGDRKDIIKNLKRDINMTSGGDREWERELRALEAEQKILIDLKSDLTKAVNAFFKIR